MEKFHILLVDPDPGNKTRLSGACAEVVHFGDFHFVREESKGLLKLNDDSPINVVFVSLELGLEAVSTFVTRAVKSRWGMNSSFIGVSYGSGDERTLRKTYPALHGFLIAPFSVKNLTEITRLASETKKEIEEKRLDSSISSIVEDAVKQIRVGFLLKSVGVDSVSESERLNGLKNTIKNIPKSQHDRYYRILVNTFVAIDHPDVIPPGINYRGASKRIRQKIEQLIISDGGIEE
jgi:hypothetical protein